MTDRSLPQDPRVREVVAAFESLQPATLPRVAGLYSDDALFKDPFNEVRGPAAIRRIFEHMFTQVDAPRFHVVSAAAEGDRAFIEWTLAYRGRGSGAREESIRGCSALRFDGAGRICWHRDYWDAAEELYEKLPMLGMLMRALKRRLAA